MWLEHQHADADTICLHLVFEAAIGELRLLAEVDAVCVDIPPAVFICNEGFASCVPL